MLLYPLGQAAAPPQYALRAADVYLQGYRSAGLAAQISLSICNHNAARQPELAYIHVFREGTGYAKLPA
jgi:hypothetical protein